ncbi:hypothetical protein HYU45_01725 [Candidatus Daviesbacteria bacterium]|nr:hypothetical protein [Candidatus Daviesbacteria bacterium]
MDDAAEKPQPPQEFKQSKNLEPIGARILGDVDPTLLTQEQFDTNPNLLYHGAAGRFDFQPAFDYRSADYCTDTDGSETLGEGFYTTDSVSAAENYSLVRQHIGKPQPIVMKVLPYQAKVLDLRATTDSSVNVPVSTDFFNSWYEHYKKYFEDQTIIENQPWNIRAMETEYWNFLNRAKRRVDTGEPIDLRVMLGTAPFAKLRSPNWPSPCYMKLFSNFMVDQGYDGLIYIEGGEGGKKQSSPSYVFYNLEKVGTYDSWKSRKTQTSD